MRIWPVAILLTSATLEAQQFDSSRIQRWADIYARAQRAQQASDWRTALTLYDSVIALEPRNSIAFFQRGLVYHNLGDKEKSIADLKKSEALGNPQATFFLSGEGSRPVAPPDVPTMDRIARESRATPRIMRIAIPSSLPGELFLLSALIALVSGGLALWVKLTPPGMTSEDEIQPGEKMLWAGAPARSLYADLTYLPSTLFAVVWFTILYKQGFRLSNFLRGPDLFTAFQFVFALVGAWTLVGRYFNELRQRKQSTYLLTDQRALVTRGSFITEHPLKELGQLKAWRHMDGTCTLGSPQHKAIFRHINDGDRVKTLIGETLAKAER